MLDNAPANAAYYGFDAIPAYSPGDTGILYVFNNIFFMHENEMYDELSAQGLSDSNMLKIRVNDDTVVFKKFLVE
jgi:hypothetical protein